MKQEELRSLPKAEIPKVAKQLCKTDIDFLFRMLEEKDDTTRYNAFLLLQANSRQFPYTYEYFDELEKKLENANSYQRSIGLMLISENVRWDKDSKFDKIFSKYISCCTDEKFITARQAIQGLENFLKSTDRYDDKIRQSFTHLSLAQYKDNQQRLLKKDISNIIKMIENKLKSHQKSLARQ